MKIIRSTAFCLAALLLFQSCFRNSNKTLDNTLAQTQNITSGCRSLILFINSGNNETSDFLGIKFQIDEDGSLAANGRVKNSNLPFNCGSNKLIIDFE